MNINRETERYLLNTLYNNMSRLYNGLYRVCVGVYKGEGGEEEMEWSRRREVGSKV